jgi:hypothetical protein
MPFDGELDRDGNVADVGQPQIAETDVKCKAAPRPVLTCDCGEQLAERLDGRIRGNAQRAVQSYVRHPFSVF